MRLYWSSIFAVSFAAFSLLPLHACLNEYHRKAAVVEPTPVPVIEQISQPRDAVDWQRQLAEAEQKIRDSGDYRLQNDLAVALVHNGQYEKALSYFNSIEQNQPALYRTAANIGTTYELMGDNREAMRWIRKG
jgi:tetratricopeptide (TPR) repeat protein